MKVVGVALNSCLLCEGGCGCGGSRIRGRGCGRGGRRRRRRQSQDGCECAPIMACPRWRSGRWRFSQAWRTGSRKLAAIRVIDMRSLAAAMVVVVQHCELGAVDGAQILDRHAQHYRHHDIDLRLRVTAILCPTQRCIRGPLRTNRTARHNAPRSVSHPRMPHPNTPPIGRRRRS